MEAIDRGLMEVLEVGQRLDQEGEEEVEARRVQKERCRCIKGRESGDGASCDRSNNPPTPQKASEQASEDMGRARPQDHTRTRSAL